MRPVGRLRHPHETVLPIIIIIIKPASHIITSLQEVQSKEDHVKYTARTPSAKSRLENSVEKMSQFLQNKTGEEGTERNF